MVEPVASRSSTPTASQIPSRAALAVYHQLGDHLLDELGASPSPATRALYHQLLAAT